MRLVTRQQWGARPPRSIVPLPGSAIDTTVFHYSGADADEQADHAKCAGRVRGIQRFHMDTRGWLDIAYSFLVCVHGYVFAARGYGVRTAATGRALARHLLPRQRQRGPRRRHPSRAGGTRRDCARDQRALRARHALRRPPRLHADGLPRRQALPLYPLARVRTGERTQRPFEGAALAPALAALEAGRGRGTVRGGRRGGSPRGRGRSPMRSTLASSSAAEPMGTDRLLARERMVESAARRRIAAAP
jgi:hypothetical protein